jgi:hypothetical protein
LIEPVATPEFFRYLGKTPLGAFLGAATPLARAARRRRERFPSRADAIVAYSGKALFARFAPGAVDDYLEDGLIEDGVDLRLSCPPFWEAATFAAMDNDFWRAARRLQAPLSVLGAEDPSTTLFGDAAGRLRRLGAIVALQAGSSHLLPMEAPERAALFLETGE